MNQYEMSLMVLKMLDEVNRLEIRLYGYLRNKANNLPHSDQETFGIYRIHSKANCAPPCPFHAPSDHPLKYAPIKIRSDKNFLVERICKHGVGHDDPDSVAYMRAQGHEWAGVHGCDGCCQTPPTGDHEQLTDSSKLSSIRSILEGAPKPLGNTKQQMDELTAALTAYVEELIGEDEPTRTAPTPEKGLDNLARNALRAEQRAKLKGENS